MPTTVAGPPNAATERFRASLQEYVAIRERARAAMPPLPAAASPEVIVAYSNALGSRIRELREDARQGAVLNPEITASLRSSTRQVLSEDRQGAPVIKLGNPEFDETGANVVVAVNAIYPDAAPVSLMPPALLLRFPSLPDMLEYRFVGRTLVIRDRVANIIVDYAREVAPPL